MINYGVVMQPKDIDQGYLTYAQGDQYLQCAYLLALSVKLHCKINHFTAVVDIETSKSITGTMHSVFDNVIIIDHMPPFENECLTWEITPYKETFKVESDMLITSNIDHWWQACRMKDICFTNGVRDYKLQPADDRAYRQLWQDNGLLNVYNGFMYVRHCEASMNFFKTAREVFDKYHVYRDTILKNCRHNMPDTDVVFSITAELLGRENFYLPTLDYPTFTHMKKHVNQWSPEDWQDACSWALTDDDIFIVNGYAQTVPFHYYIKDFCTQELIERYEQRVLQST